jgi:hypothetical protein
MREATEGFAGAISKFEQTLGHTDMPLERVHYFSYVAKELQHLKSSAVCDLTPCSPTTIASVSREVS